MLNEKNHHDRRLVLVLTSSRTVPEALRRTRSADEPRALQASGSGRTPDALSPRCDTRMMRTEGTFTVVSFEPAEVTPSRPISTALPVGVSVMEKLFTGGVDGRSSTLFTAAFDSVSGAGTYVAMESFEGALDGRRGTFNFVHSATTEGGGRSDEHFTIVPTSGTGDLTDILGSGGLAVDPDGGHHIWFEYELP